MAKAMKLLKIHIHPSLAEHPKVVEAKRKGHTITIMGETVVPLVEVDALVGPTCWRMTPETAKHWDLMITSVRATKYGK